MSLVLVLTLWLWGGMFWMFLDGFWFLQSTITHAETHARTVGAVFGTFFAALMLMLVFSSGIILYGSLFRSREIAFLLTIPARTQRVFLHKFQEAIVLSSWGFVLLGSPMLLAYGIVAGAPWYYYAMLLPFLVAFIYIPVASGRSSACGSCTAFPTAGLAVLVGGGVLLLASGVWMAWLLLSDPTNDLLTAGWFQETSRPAAILRTAPAAELVAEFGVAGRRRRGVVGKRAVPGAHDLQRPVVSPVGHVDGRRGSIAPPTAGCAAGRRGANAACAGLVDRALARLIGFLPATDATADRQGPAAVPPRPAAVVAVPHLLRPAGAVLLQYPPLHRTTSITSAGSTWSAS